jgi:hypothetical protein
MNGGSCDPNANRGDVNKIPAIARASAKSITGRRLDRYGTAILNARDAQRV